MSYSEIVADRTLDRIPVLVPEDLLLLEQIVWRLRGRIVEEPLQGAEAELLLVPNGRAIITISSLINNYHRKRFSIAHELGHLQMHREEMKICSREDIAEVKRTVERDLEQEANVFASCFLMPERFVRSYFTQDDSPSMTPIQMVSEMFQVSLTASACRNIDFSSEPIAIVYSREGKIQWFKATPDFFDVGVFVNVGEIVGVNTSAGRFFRGLSAPDGWRSSYAADWLRTGGFRRGAQIKEWSINMVNYESVLSLLWVDEEINDDDYF